MPPTGIETPGRGRGVPKGRGDATEARIDWWLRRRHIEVGEKLFFWWSVVGGERSLVGASYVAVSVPSCGWVLSSSPSAPVD